MIKTISLQKLIREKYVASSLSWMKLSRHITNALLDVIHSTRYKVWKRFWSSPFFPIVSKDNQWIIQKTAIINTDECFLDWKKWTFHMIDLWDQQQDDTYFFVHKHWSVHEIYSLDPKNQSSRKIKNSYVKIVCLRWEEEIFFAYKEWLGQAYKWKVIDSNGENILIKIDSDQESALTESVWENKDFNGTFWMVDTDQNKSWKNAFVGVISEKKQEKALLENY